MKAFRGTLAPVIMGVLGVTVALALGTWQLQRMAWKQALIASIEERRDDLLEQQRELKAMLGELDSVAEKCRAELARLED